MHDIIHNAPKGWKVTVEPTSLPISVDFAMEHLRLDCEEPSERLKVQQYLAAAVSMFEDRTRRALVKRTIAAYYTNVWGPTDFPIGPTSSIVSAQYRNGQFEDYVSVDAADIVMIASRDPGGFVIKAGPHPISKYQQFPEQDPERWKITYVAGYDIIPPSMQQACVVLCAWFYEEALPVTIGRIATPLPMHLDAIISQYKLYTI